MNTYLELINHSFEFPKDEFSIQSNHLYFHDLNLIDLVQKFGSPLKISYLPIIGQKIKKAHEYFNNGIKKHDYQGKYTYAYCTKSSHFKFIVEEVLKHNTQLETSSAYDMYIIESLAKEGLVNKDSLILCNGFKRPLYTEKISQLINRGFKNCIPILDNIKEIDTYLKDINVPFQIGIRMAAAEEPNFEFYTSRLGINYTKVCDFYLDKIKPNPQVTLKVLHYFINSGIKDSTYYWQELDRFITMYCELKKHCPTLDSIDIGGGFPIKNSLDFEFDYQKMVDDIILNIKEVCIRNNTPTPHIITEFGSFTVGESGMVIYNILDQKQQNDNEIWYMIDGSFITHLPDIWGLDQKFIVLPLNHWDQPYQRVNLGGLTCDSEDYYNSIIHKADLHMPKIRTEEPLYIGLFHTGAYQESLGGYGGIQHCLIPSTRHIVIDQEKETGVLKAFEYKNEQGPKHMLNVLGYGAAYSNEPHFLQNLASKV